MLGEYFGLAKLTEFHNLFSKQPCTLCTFSQREGARERGWRAYYRQAQHPLRIWLIPHCKRQRHNPAPPTPTRPWHLPEWSKSKVGSLLYLIDTDEIIESVASINMTQWKHYKSDSSVSALAVQPVCGREAAAIAPTPALLLVP